MKKLLVLCACLVFAGAEAGVGVEGPERSEAASDTAVVIRVGDAAVTVREFSDRLNLIPHPGQYRGSAEVKQALAASIVAEKVLADEARRLRLDTLRDARAAIIQAEKEAVYEQWMNQQIVKQVSVTDNALRDAYRRFREQRLVEFAQFDDSASAAAARRAAGQGEAFEKAVANAGRPVETKTLEYAEALPEVEDAVYRLSPGQLSSVVNVDGKFYLFKLKSVQPHPRYATGSFSYWHPALERRVRARLVARRFDSVVPTLLRDKSFEINREVYEYVVGEIARRLPFQNAEVSQAPELINRELANVPERMESRLGEAFMRFSDGTVWTTGDVWSRLRYGPYLLNYRSEQEFKADFDGLIRRMVVFETVVERGYRQGFQNSPYVKREAGMWRDDLLSRLFQTVIEDTVQVSDADMYSWYESHAGNYTRLEMRKVLEIVLPDRKRAESLLDSIRGGSDMTGIAHRYPGSAGRSPDSTGVHWIAKGSRGDLGQAAFQLKPGGLFGPIQLDSAHFAIIRLLEVQSEVRRPFDEVKDQVRRDVKRMKAHQALNAILEQQAPRYSISIRKDLLPGIEVLEGNLVTRKSHFPNRFAVPLTIPFDPGSSWFRRISTTTNSREKP